MSVTRTKSKPAAKAVSPNTLKDQLEASIADEEEVSPKPADPAKTARAIYYRLNGPLDSLTTDLRMDLKGVASALFALGTSMEKHEPMDADLVHWCSRVIQQKVEFIDSVSRSVAMPSAKLWRPDHNPHPSRERARCGGSGWRHREARTGCLKKPEPQKYRPTRLNQSRPRTS